MTKRTTLETLRELILDIDGVAFGEISTALDEIANTCENAISEHDALVEALQEMLKVYWNPDGKTATPFCVILAREALIQAGAIEPFPGSAHHGG